MNSKLYYCLKNLDLIHINDCIDNPEDYFSCPSCGKKLIIDKDKTGVHFFKHAKEDCNRGQYRALEIRARDILYKALKLTVPSAHLGWNNQITLKKPFMYSFDDGRILNSYGDVQVDLILYKDSRPFLVFFVCNREISDEKIVNIMECIEPSMVIDLSTIPLDIPDDILETILINSSKNREWIFNNHIHKHSEILLKASTPKNISKNENDNAYVSSCPLSHDNNKRAYVLTDCNCCDFNFTPRNFNFYAKKDKIYCSKNINVHSNVTYKEALKTPYIQEIIKHI